MSREVKVGMFGSFIITIDEKDINLEDLLGKQIINLFAYIVYHHGKTLSKERLISIFWPDSDNPENALKNAIFRLRSELEAHEQLGKIEWITTMKNGYSLVDQNGIYYETEAFDLASTRLMDHEEKTDKDYEKIFDIYSDVFLRNSLSEWAAGVRNHYHDLYIKNMLKWVDELSQRNEFDRVLGICNKALILDQYNEEFHYHYLKSLIEVKRYNDAIQYYERISKMFYQELGIPLFNKIQSLLNIISTKNDNNRTSLDELKNKVSEMADTQQGPYYCDYAMFKGLYQAEKRNCLRENKLKYVILLEVKSMEREYGLVYTNRLIDTIKKVARKNDIFSQISKTQIAMLVSLKNESDGYVIIDRLLNEFYRKVPRNRARINYQLSSILDEKTHERLKETAI